MVFNEEKLLEQCLESLDRQTFDGRQFEVLVIDDESDDRSFNIVKEFINRRVRRHPRFRVIRIKHGGLSVARNVGIRESDGELIAFIDGDAIADARWVEELVDTCASGRLLWRSH